MIELIFSADRIKHIPNDVSHHARVCDVMREIGVPVIGTLMLRTVAAGVLVMRTEEDIDDDAWIWRWYTDDEWLSFSPEKLPHGGNVIAEGSGDGYSWKNYGPFDDGEI